MLTSDTDNILINKFFSKIYMDYVNSLYDDRTDGNWTSIQDEQDYDITFTPNNVMFKKYGLRQLPYVRNDPNSKWEIVDTEKYLQFKMRYL